MTEVPPSPDLELVAAEGPSGGPVHRYRGAEIRCAKGDHVCALLMEGHPLNGATFGAVGTVNPWWICGSVNDACPATCAPC
jgi:hypothetical protein